MGRKRLESQIKNNIGIKTFILMSVIAGEIWRISDRVNK
jgi:hypothetical protein